MQIRYITLHMLFPGEYVMSRLTRGMITMIGV